MSSRVRFPVLPWEFSLKGRIPAVGWQYLSLRALLALHPSISPLTSWGQRNCVSWKSQPQKSVKILPCPGGKTTKSTRTCGALGKKWNFWYIPCPLHGPPIPPSFMSRLTNFNPQDGRTFVCINRKGKGSRSEFTGRSFFTDSKLRLKCD